MLLLRFVWISGLAALCPVAPLGILDLEIKSFKKKYAHKKVRGRM
jgi:hypothetical protein